MMSGGLSAAYTRLTPQFERANGIKVLTAFGPSMGTTDDAIPMRLARGEPVDVLIMVGAALDHLIKEGKVVASSRIDLAQSPIGAAVMAGAPKPDISSVDALKRTLSSVKSIAYSESATGIYLEAELFKRLGIADGMKGKKKTIPGLSVTDVVARGEAEIGFQQVSEWKAAHGVNYVGPLPSEVQKMTMFSAGVAAGAATSAAANALIDFLVSPAAATVITETGLVPVIRVDSK